MEKEDLWGDLSNVRGNTSLVFDLMNQQVELLREKTDGKVQALFDEVKYSYSDLKGKSFYETIAETLNSINTVVPKGKQEIIENKDLIDASSLFVSKDYKFEIFNDKYRFRVFTLHYKSAFPLSMDVEYGILGDKTEKIDIYDYDSFKGYISNILTSNKVIYIIQKLMGKI